MKNDNSTKQSNVSKPMLANRLFKFRAWVKEQNRMIKVFGFNEHLVFEQTWDSPSIKENIFEIEDCHIMQFTGLIDKKGTEIFEGDILKNPSEKKDIVIWFGNGFYGKSKHSHDKNRIISNPLCFDYLENKEIIGNIYENPDLLTN